MEEGTEADGTEEVVEEAVAVAVEGAEVAVLVEEEVVVREEDEEEEAKAKLLISQGGVTVDKSIRISTYDMIHIQSR